MKGLRNFAKMGYLRGWNFKTKTDPRKKQLKDRMTEMTNGIRISMQYFAEQTKITDLIDPEVMSDMIDDAKSLR